MNLDQKLRQTGDELDRVVSGRRPPSAFHRRDHRGPVVAVATAAAILAPVIVISALVFNPSEPGLSDPVGSTPDQPETATTTTRPSTTTTRIGDGLSQADQLPPGWDRGLGAEAALVLAEDGIALAVSEEGGFGFTTLAMGATAGRTVVDSGGEIPDTAVWVETVSGNRKATVFGLVALGTIHVDIQVDGVTHLSTDRVYQRPEIGRTVFIGTLDASNLRQAGSDWQITTTSPEDVRSVVALDTPEAGDDPKGVSVRMLLAKRPLVVGRIDVDLLPRAVPCQPPDDVEAPANKRESLPGARTYSTPGDALHRFITDTASQHQLATSGYVELHTSERLIGYGIEFEGGPGFVTVVSVDQTELGWAATGWEASGC